MASAVGRTHVSAKAVTISTLERAQPRTPAGPVGRVGARRRPARAARRPPSPRQGRPADGGVRRSTCVHRPPLPARSIVNRIAIARLAEPEANVMPGPAGAPAHGHVTVATDV